MHLTTPHFKGCKSIRYLNNVGAGQENDSQQRHLCRALRHCWLTVR